MKLKILGIFFLITALCIFVHQYMVWNIWWEWEDLHHETWIIVCIVIGIISLIASLVIKK